MHAQTPTQVFLHYVFVFSFDEDPSTPPKITGYRRPTARELHDAIVQVDMAFSRWQDCARLGIDPTVLNQSLWHEELTRGEIDHLLPSLSSLRVSIAQSESDADGGNCASLRETVLAAIDSLSALAERLAAFINAYQSKCTGRTCHISVRAMEQIRVDEEWVRARFLCAAQELSRACA